jgi:hypothetical protein
VFFVCFSCKKVADWRDVCGEKVLCCRLLVSLLSVCNRVVSFSIVVSDSVLFFPLCMLCMLVDCTVYWVYVLDIAMVVYLTRAWEMGRK